MRDGKRLSRASVLRMELYLDVLETLQKAGQKHVTSSEIGDSLGVSPEKVRQDLFSLDTEGKPLVTKRSRFAAERVEFLVENN